MLPELKKRGLKTIDWVHAALTAVVFLTIAGSDVGLQNCFFPRANDDTRQFLRNLPLGMAVMTSFMFMIFPTTRKGINFSSCESPNPANNGTQDATGNNNSSPNSSGTKNDANASNNGASGEPESPDKVQVVTEKALTSSGKLLQLLPTGSVLAFQTLSATFTNQGNCYRSTGGSLLGSSPSSVPPASSLLLHRLRKDQRLQGPQRYSSAEAPPHPRQADGGTAAGIGSRA